ncbi:MAG: signal peptidase I [Clostridia bacterium]|nr:signal peptidase I [Clostridia bacterium]
MEYKDAPVLSFRPIDAKESKPQNVRRLARLHSFIRLVTLALAVMLVLLCFVIRPVRVKSDAMSPTYPPRSVVFITPEWGDPERGEVAAFTDRDAGTGEIFVRRVVAVGGDSVEIKNGTLYVNGIAPEEPYLQADQAKNVPDAAPTAVPKGCVFVLGDDRGEQNAVGIIDVRSIIGVVRFSIGR